MDVTTVDLRPSPPQTGWQWFRLVGNVLNLTTPGGLVVALIGDAKIRRGPRGLFLCEGYRLKFPVAGAFTIGNVITTGSTWEQQLRQYPELLRHEEQHSWQYVYCLGLPYYVAYVACMAWSVLRTGDRAAQNFFERRAGLVIGGYRELPTRPVRENLAAIIRKGK
ncbi:MAG TPA: hypothetical protein VE462_02830 [Propionibacteriaceae bacterium]|jgi:hypothetical protein|nr:hypothetical protein [Propionibacteriaceae bacterium]